MSLWKKVYEKFKCRKSGIPEHSQKFGKFLMKPTEWIEIKVPSAISKVARKIKGKSEEE